MKPSIIGIFFLAATTAAAQQPDPIEVEGQPLAANVSRLLEALNFLGAPIAGADRLQKAVTDQDADALQNQLDRQVLLQVHINPESRVKVARGPATAELTQSAHTPFLVKIHNEADVTSRLRISSPQAGKVYAGGSPFTMKRMETPKLVENENTEGKKDRFLEAEMFTDQPMTANLSGLDVEYAIVLLASSQSGKREATIAFDVGDGSQDIGFRGEVPVLFDVKPALPVKLSIKDFDGQPTTARLVIQDRLGKVYPSQAKRLAPDLFFQKQIYRLHGESITLPPGDYSIEYSRGPEYRVKRQKFSVGAEKPSTLDLKLDRWVNPEEVGFYSGDHHIHASGCAHYQSPTVGIGPLDIFRHVKGEGLNVGCILTWGPGFDHQRQFFAPDAHAVSEAKTLVKYDLEISGFGSAPLGHVCLLNLQNQTYPGSEGGSEKGWPSWTIPVMRWTKEQGGYTGYAHSASGLHIDEIGEAARLLKTLDTDQNGQLSISETKGILLPHSFSKIDLSGDGLLSEPELRQSLTNAASELPNYAIPAMAGVGAMEIAVSSALGLCDFISAMDTKRIQEWNTWYHLLNCGMKVKVSGETDFPCMSGTRVGQGRVYVQMGKVEKLDFAEWCKQLAAGRSYVSDGYAHALGFTVNDTQSGFGDVQLDGPGKVKVQARVTFAPEIPIGVAYGNQQPPTGKRTIGDTVHLHVPATNETEKNAERLIELIVNGEVVAKQKIQANGKAVDLSWDIPIEQSSWVALRQFPQLHTNPVNVIINKKPIRASKRSAQWCIAMTEKLWNNRVNAIHEDERKEARRTYDEALAIYERIAAEAKK